MDKKYTYIKERVLYIAEYKGISKEKFLETIGMTYGSFKGIAKKGSLNSDAIAKIYTKYPDIDPSWLITGEGNMIKKPQVVEFTSSIVNDDSEKFNSLEDAIKAYKYLYLQYNELLLELEGKKKWIENAKKMIKETFSLD